MALPLLAGIAVGSLAVMAFNNKDELKEKVGSSAQKAKELAQTGAQKTKEVAKSVKEGARKKLGSQQEDTQLKEDEDA
jgi:hypothetical protein